ncbi:hypothetical protein AYO22_09670 [Fonsecaea multimorphosa]|nr:hypothetical protein AYO22_09670 [Fonsecaea multimorphosa]
MIDGPRESLSTYTRERVKSIYQDGLEWKKTNSIGQPRTFHARAIDHDATSDLFYIFTAARQKERLREMSRSYFHAVREPQDHVAQLDQKIAALIDCCYDGILDEDYMVSKACALLSRMPATPPLTQALIAMFRGSKFNWLYFEGVHDSHVPLDRDTWDKLLVTRWFDTNTIKIALTIVQSLLWDETSYRSVSGARAVSITDSDGGYIRYCRASPQTIAVSHVWAHGAGGRPHTGFNDCLHQRLVRIARENNCDSYWMDTPCIPEDHQLRAEAITYINEVFHTSSMTLVWDRDLMAIDISHASIETQEAILCTLLVCDWALRSWTLLESMRARHNIHLLCKDNKTIALRDCLLNVHHDGAIDIATLLLTSQQLLPTAKYDVESPDEEILKQMEGYVPVEEALHLLARRHASRPGDSIVILSLLIDDKPVYTAEAFWKSKIGYSLSTGVLFSSQPRLRCKGFRWAPSQPELPLAVSNRVSPYSQEHLFDGSRTTIAIITPDGLDGRFATFEIPELGQEPRENTALTSLIQKLPWLGHRGREPVQARILRGHFQLGKYQHSMLLLPVHDNTSRGALFHAYRGRSNGLVFAVVGSNDEDRRTWQWLGTFEWDLNSPPHPKVRKEREKIFIV